MARIYLATASSVMAEGQPVGRVCVLRDITHFKELDALKSEFVATVSHDLRSPLTLMRGYATMLEMVGELNEQQNGYVRKIIIGVESMSRLVNNLLDLGRIEAGVGLQLEMVPLHDMVERVIGALQLQATQKHIQLTVGYPPAHRPADRSRPGPAAAGPAQPGRERHQVHRPRGQGAGACVRREHDGMVFEVSDTGIGIAPVDLPRLFEKFYRGAQQRARKQHAAPGWAWRSSNPSPSGTAAGCGWKASWARAAPSTC